MGSITENVRRVREEIAEAALRAGRKPEDIVLVAASKTKDAEAVREAVRAGVDACGENRVNEFLEKDALGAYDGAPKHFIGDQDEEDAFAVVYRRQAGDYGLIVDSDED